jgi:hypothetical protein
MKPEGSLLCSYQLPDGPYPEQYESSPLCHNSQCFSTIHFNEYYLPVYT